MDEHIAKDIAAKQSYLATIDKAYHDFVQAIKDIPCMRYQSELAMNQFCLGRATLKDGVVSVPMQKPEAPQQQEDTKAAE